MRMKSTRYLAALLALSFFCAAFADKKPVEPPKKLFTDTAYEAMVQGRGQTQRNKFMRHQGISRRRRLADINFQHISAVKPNKKDTLTLNLFTGEAFQFLPKKTMRRNATNFTWFGTLKGRKGSSAGITVYKGAMYGRITTGDGRMFGIVPGPAGLHEIIELDPAAFPEDPNDAVILPQEDPYENPPRLMETSDILPSAMSNPNTTNGTIMDVIILYSDDAQAYPSWEFSDVMSMIWAAVDWTNLAYESSQLGLRLRPVYIGMVYYNEPTECGNALNDLRYGNPPFSNLSSLRATYGGDIVTLILDECNSGGNPICGKGYQFTNTAFASYFADTGAFSVVKDSCSAWNLTFGHEIGHNQGLFHAQGDSSGSGLYDYSFGNRFGTVDQPEFYRTMMAYNPGWRMPCLSDPDVPYVPDSSFSNGYEPTDPQPAYITGIPDEADNARTLLESSPYVASFRDSTFNLTPDYFGFAEFASRWGDTNCDACGGADLSLDHSVNYQDMPTFALRWLGDALP